MDWSDRYQTPLSHLFSRSHKLSLEHRVELSLIRSLSLRGLIPAAAYPSIKSVLASGKVTLDRTLAIEKETHHDIMAMVKAISEQNEEYGGFVHYGATSQDINDTVLALQIQESKTLLLEATESVRIQLTRLSSKYAALTSIARTHGQHAIPITMGFKFANYLYEFTLAESYLKRTVVPGKFGGAVGTFASLGTKEVEKGIMQDLGLEAVPISTQVVSRLHLADFIFSLTAISSSLERLGKEIRNLQRTEINETSEGFSGKQVGSSTMPQKRNPHKSERVCGLARIVRAQLDPMLETISVEHERDLTNSSVERVAVPTAVCLTHYILIEMEKILSVLEVDEHSVHVNLNLLGGKQLSERIMMALASKVGRQAAHEILRTHAGKQNFVEELKKDQQIATALTHEDLDRLLDPKTYTGLATQIVEDIVQKFGVQSKKETSSSHSSSSSAPASGATSTLSYRSAGVDITAGDDLVQFIKPLAAATARVGCDASIGGFGGCFDLKPLLSFLSPSSSSSSSPSSTYTDPILVACTDGVGTKLTVAHLSSNHTTIGIDLVAMSINDLIVQGAEPLVFLDYFATGRLVVPQARDVISGISRACVESGCALVGGETAEMPGLYHGQDYDLAGFAVGIVDRSHLLPRVNDIHEGDVILGIASAGIHSNGYSLVRKIVQDNGLDWAGAPPYPSSHKRLCDDLLTPTKLYVQCLLPLLKKSSPLTSGIKALAHITGGGLIENIPRVLPKETGAELDASSWPILDAFKWLAKGTKVGEVGTREMSRTFNLGVGMVVVVAKEEAEKVRKEIELKGEKCYTIGRVTKRVGGENEDQVQILNLAKALGR